MLKTFLFSQWLFDEPDWDLRKAGQTRNLPRRVMERGGGGEGGALWPQLVSYPLQSTAEGATVSPEPSGRDPSLC